MDYKHYLDQAQLCGGFAKRATTPELRSQWETLAEGWLSLLPHEEGVAPEFVPTSHERRSDTGARAPGGAIIVGSGPKT